MELLAKETVSEQVEVFGTLTLDGAKLEFTCVEASILPDDCIDE